MQNTSNLKGRAARGLSAFGLVTGLLLSLVAAPSATKASSAALPQAKAPAAITVPAGGTATVTVRGFCLDFGKPFPTGDTTPNGLAADNVRAGLNYSIDKGYTNSNAAQVELATWFLRDNTWHVAEHTLGQEIVTNATANNAPPAGTAGISLVDAIAQNKVTVTAKFVPQTADHFYGDGQAVIKNSGTADLQVYLPVGTVFSAGAGANFQTLAAYALDVQAAQVTVTAGATTSPAVTVSPAVTGTVGTTATVVTSPTSVVTSTVAVETPTTAATVAVTTPTEPATATVEATATTAMETPTAVPGASTLPQTGGSEGGSTILLALLLTAIALLVAGSGAALAHRHRA